MDIYIAAVLLVTLSAALVYVWHREAHGIANAWRANRMYIDPAKRCRDAGP